METAASGPAITASGLRKSYGAKVVLDGVSLRVDSGTVFCLLGPNGAGKTTTVQILSTLLAADAGEVRVAGHDPVREAAAVRAAIGVTGQFSAVDGLLTGRENLLLMGALNHLPRRESQRRADELLERFDLVDAGGRRVSTYSGGMRRRLDLAMTLVGEPQVIFLDEPTTGLDPRSRRTMWQIVRSLVEQGVTIFLTTQYLDEADELADRIAVLDQGRIVATGTSAELKRLVPGGHIRLQFAEESQLEAAERLLTGASRGEGLSLHVPGEAGVSVLRSLTARLEDAGIEVEGLSVHTPDLDDVFFALTGRGTSDGENQEVEIVAQATENAENGDRRKESAK